MCLAHDSGKSFNYINICILITASEVRYKIDLTAFLLIPLIIMFLLIIFIVRQIF